jgi:hypothetical protein
MRAMEADSDTQGDRDRDELSRLCREVREARDTLNEREAELLGQLQAMAARCRCKTMRERANHARELKRVGRIARNWLFAR